MTELVHPESSRAVTGRLRPSGKASRIGTSDWLSPELLRKRRILDPATVHHVRRADSDEATSPGEEVGENDCPFGNMGVVSLGISLGTVEGVGVTPNGESEVEDCELIEDVETEMGTERGLDISVTRGRESVVEEGFT